MFKFRGLWKWWMNRKNIVSIKEKERFDIDRNLKELRLEIVKGNKLLFCVYNELVALNKKFKIRRRVK